MTARPSSEGSWGQAPGCRETILLDNFWYTIMDARQWYMEHRPDMLLMAITQQLTLTKDKRVIRRRAGTNRARTEEAHTSAGTLLYQISPRKARLLSRALGLAVNTVRSDGLVTALHHSALIADNEVQSGQLYNHYNHYCLSPDAVGGLRDTIGAIIHQHRGYIETMYGTAAVEPQEELEFQYDPERHLNPYTVDMPRRSSVLIKDIVGDPWLVVPKALHGVITRDIRNMAQELYTSEMCAPHGGEPVYLDPVGINVLIDALKESGIDEVFPQLVRHLMGWQPCHDCYGCVNQAVIEPYLFYPWDCKTCGGSGGWGGWYPTGEHPNCHVKGCWAIDALTGRM